MFGTALFAMAVLAAFAATSRPFRAAGPRAFVHAGLFAAIIGTGSAAGLVSLVFLADRLVDAPDPGAMLHFADLIDSAVLVIWLLFGVLGGLLSSVLACVFTSEGASGPSPVQGRMRSFAGWCLILAAIVSLVLPIPVVHMILTTADAARAASGA